MKLFELQIMTPEKEFYSGEAETLTVTLPDGQLTVLAGHAPMVAVLAMGEFRFKMADGRWTECVNTAGFMEVRPDKVVMFLLSCEYPEEIDAERAKAALKRAQERLQDSKTKREHELARAAMTRAMVRLRATKSRKYKI